MSAVVAGAISNTVTNPVWVIRARLQTQEHIIQKAEYSGTLDAARKMLRQEGIMSFYKGLMPSMWSLMHVAVQFPLYEKLKQVLHIEDSQGSQFTLDNAIHLIAASSASKLVASLTTYPLEVVRIRMQIQRNDNGGTLRYQGVVSSLRIIVQEEGMRGLYAGLQTNLLRVVPACAITFTSYEFLLRQMKKIEPWLVNEW